MRTLLAELPANLTPDGPVLQEGSREKVFGSTQMRFNPFPSIGSPSPRSLALTTLPLALLSLLLLRILHSPYASLFEMSLPSYADATAGPSIFALIFPFLDGTSIVNCTLVSTEANSVLQPLLWKDPIKYLATGKKPNERVFKFFEDGPNSPGFTHKTWALVTTIDFRPLRNPSLRPNRGDFIYRDFITPRWIYAFIFNSYFQNAKFLILDGLIDLTRPTSPMRSSRDQPQLQELSDRLAGTSFSSNTTPSSSKTTPPPGNEPWRQHVAPLLLSLFNCHVVDISCAAIAPFLENLLYLDISYIKQPKDWLHLLSSYRLKNLRILKMRGIGITSFDVSHLLLANASRLWCLDIRDNKLDDMTVASIISYSTRHLRTSHRKPEDFILDEIYYEDPPLYREYGSSPAFPRLRPDSPDEVIAHIENHSTVSSGHLILDPDDGLLAQTGVTHLYLSGNNISPKLLVSLIVHACSTLQVIDVGTVYCPKFNGFNLPQSPLIQHIRVYATPLDNAEILHRCNSSSLEVLRIHHSAVTLCPTIRIPDQTNAQPKTLELVNRLYTEIRGFLAGFGEFSSLLPNMNPRLHTLTLTSVPRHTNQPVVQSLIEFLCRCYDQEVAISERRQSADRHNPELLSGLRVLRLEFEPLLPSSPNGPSVTGDADADVFQAESAGDFSFFDDAIKKEDKPSTQDVEEVQEDQDVIKSLKAFREKEGRKWGGSLELIFPSY